MRYRAEYSRAAQSYLRRATPTVRQRIFDRVEALCVDPLAPGLSKPLRGRQVALRSSRVGGLRVLYEVLAERLIVNVVRVGPRGDVYEG